jgi:pSer/pThr/pTyr-binding forkhead associated (FHA) protein/ribosomal protein L40E
MIVCPNCNHQNPDAATQCEACYTPLPSMTACPNCGAAVQTDASFCGQCGSNLQDKASTEEATPGGSPLPATLSPDFDSPDIPDLPPIEPLVEPEPLVAHSSTSAENQESEVPDVTTASSHEAAPAVPPPTIVQSSAQSAPPSPHKTQLQTQVARLFQVQTNTTIELPGHLTVIHVGKPNDRIPPDVDVSGFPNSEIVSRIHADIRVEGDLYYIEDVGSSNGTYINNVPLPAGNRHRLRPGDRIGLGKGDKVTFLFQLT